MKKVVAVLLMTTLLLGLTAVASAAGVTTDGLVLYYSFDGGNAKNEAKTGATLDGEVADVAFVDGVSGKAASFKSEDNSNIAFNFAEGYASFTISFWYQVGEIIDDENPYALIGSTAWDANAVHCHITGGVVRAAFNSSTVIYSDLNTNKYGKTKGREAEVNFPLTEDVLNKWINFTVTYDGASMTRHFYMNGTLVGEDVADSSVSTTFLLGEIQIGSWRADAKRYFTGKMDELRIYNRAITANEVKDIVKVNANAVVISEPTPTPPATPTPEATPTPIATERVATPTPSVTPKTSPTATTGAVTPDDNSALIWIIIGGVLVVAAVAAGIIVYSKKKKGNGDIDPPSAE